MVDAALAVRLAHVLAAAFVVGGAALAAWRPTPSTARAYEWGFWAAAPALVLTGIGNAGARGAPPDAWSLLLAWKLGILAALLVGSALRTLLVALDARPRALSASYGATALAAGIALALGVALAHG